MSRARFSTRSENRLRRRARQSAIESPTKKRAPQGAKSNTENRKQSKNNFKFRKLRRAALLLNSAFLKLPIHRKSLRGTSV